MNAIVSYQITCNYKLCKLRKANRMPIKDFACTWYYFTNAIKDNFSSDVLSRMTVPEDLRFKYYCELWRNNIIAKYDDKDT